MREGINNPAKRLGYSVANENVLKKYLELNGFEINDDLVSWPEENVIELVGRNKVFIKLVKEHGPIVTFQEICNYFESEDLSRASATSITCFSPLAQKVSYGLYKLCGQHISPSDYLEAEKRRSRIPAESEHEYTIDGEIIFRTNIGAWGLGGVVSAAGIPNISGEWNAYIEDEYICEISVDENFIWRLYPIIEKLNVNLGDRMEFIFNLWKKKVNLRII